jgi:hypothetical protein
MSDDVGDCGGNDGGVCENTIGSGGYESTSYHRDSGHCDVSTDQNDFKDYSFDSGGNLAPGIYNYDADNSYNSTERNKNVKEVKREGKDMRQQDCCILI